MASSNDQYLFCGIRLCAGFQSLKIRSRVKNIKYNIGIQYDLASYLVLLMAGSLKVFLEGSGVLNR